MHQTTANQLEFSSWMSLKALESGELFRIERDPRLKNIGVVTAIGGIIIGVYLSWVDLREIDSDFYESLVQKGAVTLAPTVDLSKPEPPKPEPTQAKPVTQQVKPIQPAAQSKPNQGGGNSSKPISTKGIFGIMSASVATSSANAIFGEGGTASGIDKILAGTNGLKQGSGGVTRRGDVEMLGDGDGTFPGFDGGNSTGDVVALVDNLIKGGGERTKLRASPKQRIIAAEPDGASSAGISGKRSRSDIVRVVNQNMQGLRYIYNRYLRDTPGLKGKVTLKWAVDEFGNVLFCTMVSSTMGNSEFEKAILEAIKQWRFTSIEVTGDVTEVVYPFVFTQ